jgi:hypothetical protein
MPVATVCAPYGGRLGSSKYLQNITAVFLIERLRSKGLLTRAGHCFTAPLLTAHPGCLLQQSAELASGGSAELRRSMMQPIQASLHRSWRTHKARTSGPRSPSIPAAGRKPLS